MSGLALPAGGIDEGRLRIREPKASDIARIDALLDDPAIRRFTSLAGQPGSMGAIDPAQRGRGLGRDALRTFCRFAFDSLSLERIEATILPDNEASLKLARAVGFQDEGIRRAVVRIDDRQHDSLALSLLRGEIR